MKKIIYSISLLTLTAMVSCKKDYLDTKPSNAIVYDSIVGNTSALSNALVAAYKEQFAFGTGGGTGHDNFGQKSYDLASDLMGNDMVVNTQGYGWFNTDYQYTSWLLATDNNRSFNAWFLYYDLVKQANNIITTVDNAAGTTADKDLIKGQAYGLRAYAYYYLINYFQQTFKGNETKKGVPVYLSAGVSGGPRITVQAVYTQIIADLTAAETALTGKARASKVNIDVSVVQGLRARVALLQEDWPTAATYANKARQNYSLMSTAQYGQGFSSVTNPEVMWGSIIPTDQATIYASFFSHIDITNTGYAALGGQKKITKALYDQISTGDVRKTIFTLPTSTSTTNPAYNQQKFRVPTVGSWAGDYLYMRSAEMYLIEAEALARQSQDANARTILETLVKNRYPAYSAASLSGTTLLNEILLQRRVELWGEGFSLIDIKRLKTGLNRPTGAGNHGSPNYNPVVYTTAPDDSRFLMRVPQKELDNNENMTPADQNP